MAIIYSYPEKISPSGGDFLVITDSAQAAPNKNRTKSLTIDNLADYVITSKSAITGGGTFNTLAMFTPDGKTIGDSIVTYNTPGNFIQIGAGTTIDTTSVSTTNLTASTTATLGNTSAQSLTVAGSIRINTGYGSNFISTVSSGGLISIGQPIGGFTTNLSISGYLELNQALKDKDGDLGLAGQVLSSTGTQVEWISNTAGSVTGTGTPSTLTMWDSAGTGIQDSIVKEVAGTAYATTKNLVIDGSIYQSNTGKSVIIGEFALEDGTSGTDGENVALGYEALKEITTGTNNVGIGSETLKTVGVIKNNIAIGKKALERLQPSASRFGVGDGNIALGFSALNPDNGNVGSYNVALGITIAQDTVATSITGNILMGKGTANSNTHTGPLRNNIILGQTAFQDSTATSVEDCIFLGENAAKNLKGVGDSDIAIGKNALASFGAGAGFTSAGNNIAIGESVQSTNTTTTGNSICIGKGEARTDAICISTFKSGLANTASGTHSAIIGGYDNTVANDVGFIGGGHSNTITSVAKGGAIIGGYNNNVTSTGNAGIALGSDLEVAGTNQVVVGRFNSSNTNSRFMVGVGTSAGDRKNGFEVLQGTNTRGQLKLAQYPSNFTTTQLIQNYDVLVIQANGQVYKKPANGPTGLANLGAYQAATDQVNSSGSSLFYGPNMPRLAKLTWTGATGTGTIALPQAGDTSSPGVVNRIAEFVTDSSFPATAEIEFSVSNSGTINGNTTKTITGPYKAIKFWSDGSEWFILNEQ